MSYTRRKLREARERIDSIRSRHCSHPRMEHGGIGTYFIDYCPDCKETFIS
jgi:hypothetical protein